jgi:hypothetical protein
MAIKKVLARGWDLHINEGTYGSPSWTAIGGIKSFTFSNGKNDADTTDFDSDGDVEHIVASRSRSVGVEGHYLLDEDDGSRDDGQSAVETLGELKGNDSLGDFKLTNPAGTVKRFYASVQVGDIGGGNDDPSSWGVNLTVSGAPVDAVSTDTDFATFALLGQTGASTINTSAHTVDIEIALGSDVDGLQPIFTLSTGAVADISDFVQTSGVSVVDFTSAVTYTITAQDGVTEQNWTVTVTVAT